MTAARDREVGAGQCRPVRSEIVERLIADAARAQSDRVGRTSLDVLDVGGGTGANAVPLARAGHRVTVVDPSPDALAGLEQRVTELGVSDRVHAVQGDVEGILRVVEPADTDLVLCHNVLEVLDDREQALRAMARAVRPTGALSVIAANRYAWVWSRALTGRLDSALRTLRGEDGEATRWTTIDELRASLEQTGYRVSALQGIRIFVDLAPTDVGDGSRPAEGSSPLLELELAASGHPAFRDLGTHLHILAHLG